MSASGYPFRTYLRLTWLVTSLALLLVLLVPAQLIVPGIAPRQKSLLPQLFHRCLLALLGIRLIVRGAPARNGTLYVANHVSWTDILLLGARIKGSFVAMAEVRGWPAIGWLARLQGVIFVDRERMREAGGQAAVISARLADDDGVILFAEGRTSNGAGVLPFKSALFAAVDKAPDARIQPVSIAYTRLGDRRLAPAERAEVAWIGEMSLGKHLFRLLGQPRLTAELSFHPPVHQRDFADRKALARHCQEAVACGLESGA